METNISKLQEKLDYIQMLRGNCPNGYELEMYKAGGKTCSKCTKMKSSKGSVIDQFNTEKAKCGKKMKKKKAMGGEMENTNSIFTPKKKAGGPFTNKKFEGGPGDSNSAKTNKPTSSQMSRLKK